MGRLPRPLRRIARFLFGRFSNADAMYAPVVTRFNTYGVELQGARLRRRDARPAVDAGVARGGKAKPWSMPENDAA